MDTIYLPMTCPEGIPWDVRKCTSATARTMQEPHI